MDPELSRYKTGTDRTAKQTPPAREMTAMNVKIQSRYEARAKILKALAHPTRLYIVDQLSQKERCVCDLTKMVGVDISTVSKHLSVLKNAGIVQLEKRGLQAFYKLRVPCVTKFFDCVESIIRANAKEQMALVK
jgi:ArsR family transcriptional regulator